MEVTRRMRVVVTLMQPRKTKRRVTIQTAGREGEKQSLGLLCRLTQLCSSPSLVSPPTSVTIQSGMDRLATANMSAARKRVPEMRVSLSIVITEAHTLGGLTGLLATYQFTVYIHWSCGD